VSDASTADSRFQSAWMKVGRARTHIDALESEIGAYWQAGPVSVRGEGVVTIVGGGTGARTFTVETFKPLPDNIALLAGDAAHNLRAALDHFTWGAVAEPDTRTMFPIWGRQQAPSQQGWQSEVNRRLRSASPALVEAVLRMQPWETGREKHLWQVHELDRIDKHRLVLAVAAAQAAIRFDLPSPVLNPAGDLRPGTMPLALAPKKWTPLEAGAVLWHVPEGSPPLHDPTSFEYDVQLGEVAGLKGLPVVAQLRILANHVEIWPSRCSPRWPSASSEPWQGCSESILLHLVHGLCYVLLLSQRSGQGCWRRGIEVEQPLLSWPSIARLRSKLRRVGVNGG
jgi:hypothetical protein